MDPFVPDPGRPTRSMHFYEVCLSTVVGWALSTLHFNVVWRFWLLQKHVKMQRSSFAVSRDHIKMHGCCGCLSQDHVKMQGSHVALSGNHIKMHGCWWLIFTEHVKMHAFWASKSHIFTQSRDCIFTWFSCRTHVFHALKRPGTILPVVKGPRDYIFNGFLAFV